MSLRRKTFLAMTITLAALIMLLYFILSSILNDSFMMLDRQAALRNVDRTVNSFQDKVDDLQRSMNDWSSWEETYAFVQDGNAGYIESNLSDDSLWSINVNLVVYLNKANQLVYAKAVDFHADWQDNMVQNFQDFARSKPSFLRLMSTAPTAGFVMIAGEPMLIASRPVLHNDETGPVAGTLIWGQHLGADELATVARSLRLSLDLLDTGLPDVPADVLSAQEELSPATLRTTVVLNDTEIGGYTLLNDIFQQPTLMLRVTQERSVYLGGRDSLNSFLAAMIIVGVIVGAGMLLLLERLLLLRLAQLVERVHYIGVNDDFSMRLPVAGDDELTELVTTINSMLNTVSESRAALQRSNDHLEIQGNERMLELERQKSNLQAIMDTMGEGLVYCVDGLVTYVNRAFGDLLNYEVSELVGKPFTLLNTQHDPLQTPVYFSTPRRYETTLVRHDGSTISVAITSTLVESNDKRRSQVIIVRDITKEVATKRQKDYFFARASHDLRSPLTNIMTRLYLLGKKPEQLETHLKILDHISTHMLELVNDLLDVSRFERGSTVLNRRDLVLQTIVDQVVEVQQADAEMKQLALTTHLSDMPLQVYGDPVRLNQVITNLVSNAIHYTPEGGEIIIDVGVGEYNGERRAVIQVADTGIGISPDHIDHIFDPFFRVSSEREGGSGLGLYIVQEIVQLHGGEISVTSEIGKGTIFFVYLHLSSPAELKSQTTSPLSIGR